MPEPAAPNVVMVPVKRFDVSLTLQDILTPLAQTADKLAADATRGILDPVLHGHILEVSALAAKLKEAVDRIHAIDPKLLAPAPPKPQD